MNTRYKLGQMAVEATAQGGFVTLQYAGNASEVTKLSVEGAGADHGVLEGEGKDGSRVFVAVDSLDAVIIPTNSNYSISGWG